MWGNSMKDFVKTTGLDKGRAGELAFQETIIKMEKAGIIRDYKRPTYTNEPDGGADFILEAPHNIGEMMGRLKEGNVTNFPVSKKKVNVRVDVKYYNQKIGKAVVDKFIADIKRNPGCDEHWLAGGNGVTGPARNALDKAPEPCRYYSQDDINTIDNTLSEILENMMDVIT